NFFARRSSTACTASAVEGISTPKGTEMAMKKQTLIAFAVGGAAIIQVNLIAPAFADAARIVVTNDDSLEGNTTTLYRVKDKQLVPSLKLKSTIATGGVGDGDGYLEGQQQTFVRSGVDSC